MTAPKASPAGANLEYLMRVTLTLTDHETGRTWALPAGRLGLAFYLMAGGPVAGRPHPQAEARASAGVARTTDMILALCRATLGSAPISDALAALAEAPVVPAGVPFPLMDAVITWGKGETARTMAGAHAIRALAYLYRIRRGGGWDDRAVVGPVLEGLGLASELLAEQHAALAVDRDDLDLILTALGAATATYAARLDFTRAEVLGLDDAMIQRATPKAGA